MVKIKKLANKTKEEMNMRTCAATGAVNAMRRMTVPEMRQKLYPIRGGMKKDVKNKNFGTYI